MPSSARCCGRSSNTALHLRARQVPELPEEVAAEHGLLAMCAAERKRGAPGEELPPFYLYMRQRLVDVGIMEANPDKGGVTVFKVRGWVGKAPGWRIAGEIASRSAQVFYPTFPVPPCCRSSPTKSRFLAS